MATESVIPGDRPTLAESAVRRRTGELQQSARSDVQALMDAGLALMLADGGRRAPRVADIVAAAGLSNDSFYRYFAGKGALVEAIVEQGARTVVSYVRHCMAAAGDPEDRVRAGISAVMRQASDSGLAAQTRMVLANATGMPSSSRHVSVGLVDALTELFAGSIAECGVADPERVARTLSAAVVGVMQDHLFRASAPDDEDIARLARFALAEAESHS
ncbi:hypothetical protein GCM10023205_61870 [Yinghuangia aomiensis]|uniref:HTH tetR-type domain-containing protein n=1 Tax=Yinghuangia aomiensis TaxID=676205 RepID=A0ABP9HZW7_9ACTN